MCHSHGLHVSVIVSLEPWLNAAVEDAMVGMPVNVLHSRDLIHLHLALLV